jgi:hypothetical protein
MSDDDFEVVVRQAGARVTGGSSAVAIGAALGRAARGKKDERVRSKRRGRSGARDQTRRPAL